LNQHLHCIRKSPSPNCPHCTDIPETVQHFLLLCPQYTCEHHTLSNILKHKVLSMPFLLSNKKAMNHLIYYINSTGCLKLTFSDVPPSSH
ncbi:hypothetical protein BDR06DRAFT_896920, partial [Suillus hirtellus]